jgi:hypothetical protein
MTFKILVFLTVAPACWLVGCAPSPEASHAREATSDARQLQMYGFVQKFDRFDHNGDGYLTRKEIEDGVRETGSIHLTAAEMDRVMKGYDLNRDKRISQHEAQLGAERGPQILGVH